MLIFCVSSHKYDENNNNNDNKNILFRNGKG